MTPKRPLPRIKEALMPTASTIRQSVTEIAVGMVATLSVVLSFAGTAISIAAVAALATGFPVAPQPGDLPGLAAVAVASAIISAALATIAYQLRGKVLWPWRRPKAIGQLVAQSAPNKS